ncbi:hypothetical protein RvY_06698 [Ramazzottius varieornatus]|uniref:Uncharacterized protein n=1 Tax=Ramazzottius varieornatus TaxID=947166 RepID=A0A1D1UZH0_RAMVA|nr:hypothetical protein RvY_06698 [Ramazzottius varieornatus]
MSIGFRTLTTLDLIFSLKYLNKKCLVVLEEVVGAVLTVIVAMTKMYSIKEPNSPPMRLLKKFSRTLQADIYNFQRQKK